jgi:nuclear pore complex protein Nup62
MDEILTRWASDLTKYTKEFQSHAETIAHWDQLLVDNMSKISKLYISAVTAEKQTASVEMQLSAVENQQNELESWLTKYEGEVDEMLAKNGAGQGMELGGPDQERERTYKFAEKLGERLEDMGRDLGGMIEEINAANAGLSKTTKADEPVSLTFSCLWTRTMADILDPTDHADRPNSELPSQPVASHRSRYRGSASKGSCGAEGESGPGLSRNEWEERHQQRCCR